ncbi:MAG: Endoglucanase EG-II [Claussenomyces sp. TS43310]|nr:MAG: Endoglucanase EG-II [Claussenomyces sp. TS43310]
MLKKIYIAAALVHVAVAKVMLAGINIAGFDFGCGNVVGNYTASGVTPPLLSQGSVDGAGQMNHFVTDDGLNVFRLPVCWQYLVDGTLGGDLDVANFGIYDDLVEACLATGAYCVVDVHNYARWEDAIIGQSDGAVTNDQFASLWSQIASKYADQTKVIFGIMNEPHDLDITTWATTVQSAVTAIRKAGATSQMILLPGTSYTSVGGSVSTGSASALSSIINLDGNTTNLILDVHQYIDSDTSGTSPDCTSTGINNLDTLATWLRSNGRQA